MRVFRSWWWLLVSSTVLIGGCSGLLRSPLLSRGAASREEQSAVATAVAATLQALPTVNSGGSGAAGAPQPTVAPSSPTSPPAPQPTAAPPSSTSPPAPQPTAAPPSASWARGVWVGDEASHSADLYHLPGTNLGSVANLPSNASLDADLLRPVGPDNSVTWVYTDFTPRILLFPAPGGPAQVYASLPAGPGGDAAVVALLSCPPSSHFAYSYMQYGNNYQSNSTLVVAEIGQAPRPVLTLDASEGYALHPLVYEISPQGTPRALWATTRIFGIGNVMVAPTRGLWRVDLASGQTVEVLAPSVNGVEHHVLGVAPNGAAYAYWRQDDPGHVHIAFFGHARPTITLNTTTSVVGPDSIGYAAFSADGRYVAWVEYSGSFDAGYQGHMTLYDLTSGQPMAVNNPLPASYQVYPEAWVDAHTLLLRGWNGNSAEVILWDFQNPTVPTEWLGTFLGVRY